MRDDMAAGKLVTSETVVGLMEEYINKSEKKIFLVDGYPRSQENIDVWDKMLDHKTQVLFVLLF
jgi:adenylate kinase family enzyme